MRFSSLWPGYMGEEPVWPFRAGSNRLASRSAGKRSDSVEEHQRLPSANWIQATAAPWVAMKSSAWARASSLLAWARPPARVSTLSRSEATHSSR